MTAEQTDRQEGENPEPQDPLLVDEAEMAEILSDKGLVERLRVGSSQARGGHGSFKT